MRVAGGATEASVELLVGDEAVLLSTEELDGLVDALASFGGHDAGDVAEEITAQRLAGGAIRLLPTVPQLEAVRDALDAVTGPEPLGPALLRLVGLCDPEPVAPVQPL